ncbi:hypothetical protein H2200_004907 [Cladophialophora chaetospira]|uniref:FAD/NAD(P)-binding domain-containing protein n=1 Tax=Cladophialophora chaetospira TaxID=386627 RepID=A0AA38XDZ8_9EURO|nr:hypothetical protein H2200_004907 [Cladophialophora chaetospira]
MPAPYSGDIQDGNRKRTIAIILTLSGKAIQQPAPHLVPSTMKHIVILGGSYGGISTAHRILKQYTKLEPFKITLVSPNTHFYWSMAAPRGLVPKQLTDEQLFRPIAAGFDRYTVDQFELVVASAEAVDVENKTVEVSGPSEKRTIPYDFLILATGSRTNGDTPLKCLGSTQATKDSLHELQARIAEARTITVAGAGVTGVEVAGELAYEYGRKKEIILIASEATILDETPASVAKTAMKALVDLDVKVKLHTKVASSHEMPEGGQELILSDGSKLKTDLYIPTFGLIPNSSYMAAEYFNAKGFVKVDEFLKVKGTKDIWAIGDVSDVEAAQFISCDRQSVYLAKALGSVLSKKIPLPYKVAASRFMGMQIGRKAGTGHYGNTRLPGFLFVWARKTLFIENLKGTVDGSLF